MRFSFVIIPLVIVAVAYLGKKYSQEGLGSWYRSLRKPAWTPSGGTISEVWIFIYFCTGFSALWFYNVPVISVWHYVIGLLFLINAALNVYWSKLFFAERKLAQAYQTMIVLNGTTVLIAVIIGAISIIPAIALLPYIIWVGVATVLTKKIIILNPNQQ